MPTGVISMVLLMSSAYVASKTHQTIWVILALVFPNVVGTIVLITVSPGPTTRGGLLFCFYIMQCFQAQSPLILTVSSRNIAGQTKRVIAYGATFIGWSGGNASESTCHVNRFRTEEFSCFAAVPVAVGASIYPLSVRAPWNLRGIRRPHAVYSGTPCSPQQSPGPSGSRGRRRSHPFARL
jgi:hypothetical protein